MPTITTCEVGRPLARLDRRELTRPTAEYVRAIVFAAPEDDIVERLAMAALDAIEQRDYMTEPYHALLDLMNLESSDARVERQRQIIASIRARLRERRAT